ncbi:MAG: pyrroline-5-carboxylate reductase [Candidatus Krumholzibacteriota bacterium]
MSSVTSLTVLGAGNIGTAIARGLVKAGLLDAGHITLTRRHADRLTELASEGFATTVDNKVAVAASDLVVVAVEPGQLDELLVAAGQAFEPGRHTLVSVVSGASVADIQRHLKQGVAVVRAMPNTAIAVGESMTCLAATPDGANGLALAESVFQAVGTTLVIDEEQMSSATALCACGTAFFLRAIRAASQGGIEIGFHSNDALAMAAQTAKGAAALLLARRLHPEREIDRVTTPRGATISGLNEMEHQGFSSAMIKGITTSAEKVDRLYKKKD